MFLIHRYLKRNWAAVELECFTHNLHQFEQRLSPGCRFMAVVKADAYGHGDIHVVNHLIRQGVDWFGVNSLSEAMSLREQHVSKPVLILTPTPAEYAGLLSKHNLSQTVNTKEYAQALSGAALDAGVSVKIHVKLDTGMSRIGFSALDDAAIAGTVRDIEAVYNMPGLILEGICTHFSCADELGEDSPAYTQTQFDRFMKTTGALSEKGINIAIKHCCNSAAAILYPHMHLDMVRVGIALYGLYPGDDCRAKISLKPALSWLAAIVQVKTIPAGQAVSYGRTFRPAESRKIATVAVGYADGFSRRLSNRGALLIRGRRAPIVGTVCMDQVMVDVTDIEDVTVDDVAVIIGQSDSLTASADDMAKMLDTINYEIVTRVGKRVPRVYYLNKKEAGTTDTLQSFL